MPSGLELTVQIFARSRNRAVLTLLSAALRSSDAEVRASSIRATLRRSDIHSHLQLIRYFSSCGETGLTVLRQSYRKGAHYMAPALKQAVLKGQGELRENACRIIVLCREYELFPSLVKALEQPQRREASCLVSTIAALARLLHDELLEWKTGDQTGLDPSFARHQMLHALEHALDKSTSQGIAEHRTALIDAFLLLVPSDNATLSKILRDTTHRSHAPLIKALSTGESPGVVERLVALVRDTDAPPTALHAFAGRTDRPFIHRLFRDLRHPAPLRVLHNMQRLHSVAWLESCREVLLEIDGRSQAIAVDLATSSRIPNDAIFDLLAFLMQHGLAEGRRAACQALAKFDRPQARELVRTAVSDPDAGVQAAAIRQLRARRVPDALQTLVSLLEVPSAEVREAARSSLAEFNFVRYRAMFDVLDERTLRTTGALVWQVDPSAREKLIGELLSPSVTSRLRGIEMAVTMDAANDVRQQLIELSKHENATLRQEAVIALAHCTGQAVLDALEQAARDSHQSVADSAKRSLRQIEFFESGALAHQQPAGTGGRT